MEPNREPEHAAADMLSEALERIRMGREPVIYSADRYELSGSGREAFRKARRSVENCIGARNRKDSRKIQFALEDIHKLRGIPAFNREMQKLGSADGQD